MQVIDRIELYHVNAPLPAPFTPSWMPGLVRHTVSFYLVRFITDDGVEGWSAFTGAGRERAGLGDNLAGLFLGQDPEDIERLSERIHILAVGGNFNWWLEPAFWDIKGKNAGLPVYKLLGGTDDRLRLYASSGEIRDPGERREEAEKRLAEGFDTMKIRVHDWDEKVDIEHISDIATYMQGRMKISVDCNQAFRLTQLADAPKWSLERAKRFADAAADVELAWVEGQLVVTESGLPGQVNRGGLLKKIDGQDAVAIFHRDTALYSGTPQWKVARALKNLGAGEQYSTTALELEHGGRLFRAEVERDWGDFPEPALFLELEPGYFYVNLAAIYDIDTLLGWAPRLSEAEGVIFDVRGYLQNNCSRFLPHLLSEADTAGNWIKIPQLLYPDFFQPSFEASGWLLTPKAPRIEGRLAFLTDGRTVSASESFLAFVRHYRLGAIIGGPTAGANGPRNWMRLLDGYILHWTGAYVTLPDGSPLHNQGIAPDYSAAPTLNGILNGRDEVLELALSILKRNSK